MAADRTTATISAGRGDAAGFDATACVIGAGAAGLAMGKALADRGITFDWFEKGSMVGGLWRIDNDNGGTAAYSTLHLNSSRTRTQYPSYPMPDDWPDYPSHALMAQYFQDFAQAHDLLEQITFHAEVTAVEPLPGPAGPDGDAADPGTYGWAVTTTATGTRRYRHVLVANGHHGTPNLPDLPGEFTGETFHAHDYRDPSVFAGKDVVVVGVGNSGMDIACDAAKLATRVLLVSRHGVWVLPKYAFGKPIDQLSTRAMAYVPFAVERRLYEAIVRVTTGTPQSRGLPEPDHALLCAHPTVSAELYDRVGHGDIVMKPGIELLEGDAIRFSDGTIEHADLLVLATGYRVSLPFLGPDVLDPAGNVMPLYQRVVAPHRPGLCFVGFIQTVGSGIPLYEYQAEWVGDLITGRCVLPPVPEMERWITDDAAAMRRRYVQSQRHTMQVDYWRYIRAMQQARARKAAPSLLDRVTAPLAGLR
jgi:dimethylaniline monooxygenase (N-oxide forming)